MIAADLIAKAKTAHHSAGQPLATRIADTTTDPEVRAHFRMMALAVKISRANRDARIAAEAAYERECADYAAQGYRPATCIHGTSLWVDFDPMCAWCESDIDPATWDLAAAISTARKIEADHRRKLAAALEYINALGIAGEQVGEIFDEVIRQRDAATAAALA